jgi:hypothetical protein
MPLVLLAGTVQSIKSDPFPPGDERPRCEAVILADNGLLRVVAYDETMTLMETLQPGDAVSIQGALMIETRQGKLSGIFVIAGQILPLRKRSISRVPVAAMA